jgi:hypothetical protein
MVKNNDEYGFLIPENHQIHENAIQAMSFRDQVKSLFGEGLSDDETIAAIKARRWDQNQSNRFVMAIKEVLNQGKLSDDEAIAKIKELSEQSQLLSEIGDILRMANGECFDYRRFKQEEKIVVNGFRRLCDIHLALFKKRSEYEIYGSRIIDDLLNSEDLQAQKQANQNRFDSATYDPFQDKYKLENIDHAISFRDIVATYLGCSYDRSEVIAKIEQLKRAATPTLEQQNLETFWRKIRVLFGNTEIGFESAYNRIVDLLHNPEQFTGDKDREIEPPSRVYNVHVTTTGDPSKIAESIQEEFKKAPRYDPQESLEVCEVDVNEMREKEFDMLLEKVSKLENDLHIANKVIARLVGK